MNKLLSRSNTQPLNISLYCMLVVLCVTILPTHLNASTLPTVALPTTPGEQPAKADSEDRRAIVVLGDSISASYGIQREQGWVHLLDTALAQREESWFAVNASISGETTGGGYARLAGVLAEHNPEIVIIELGGNDGLRGYPVEKIRENLRGMVDLVNASGAIPIIVAMRIPPNYGPRYTRAFDSVFGEVAEEKGTAYVPFLLEEVALADNMMQEDGIHPTAEAQPLLLDAVWEELLPLL
ncbi:MAG: arylesterase [Pseudomonadaceae bacterium]|nr:arylesterase [Pseudomonadaceae bacterium]